MASRTPRLPWLFIACGAAALILIAAVPKAGPVEPRLIFDGPDRLDAIVGATGIDSGTRAAGADAADAIQDLRTIPAPPDRTARRSRYVTIDVTAFPAPFADGRTVREPALILELFPDRAVRAVFERFDANATGVTWVGTVEDVPLSTVTLVYSDGVLTGSVVMPTGAYSIRPASAELRRTYSQPGRVLHLVTEVNQQAMLPELPPIEVVSSPAELERAADVAMTDSAEFIDILVVYTPLAMASAGGQAGINNLINLGVSETNTSYANSGIQQRIRLAHSELVNYTEVSSFSTNLNQLRAGTGAFSGVPALRDAHFADLVMLLVRPTQPDACGIGFLMTNVSTAFASSGFNVVDTTCVAGYTFAHELGHNMGARHDWYVDQSTTPFSYAHGHVNPTPGQRWRTIMAYNDHCTDQGFSCSRVLYWASPTTTYNPFCSGRGFNCGQLRYWFFPGSPMGVPGGTNTSCRAGVLPSSNCDADDARALNNTALTVANLRARQ